MTITTFVEEFAQSILEQKDILRHAMAGAANFPGSSEGAVVVLRRAGAIVQSKASVLAGAALLDDTLCDDAKKSLSTNVVEAAATMVTCATRVGGSATLRRVIRDALDAILDDLVLFVARVDARDDAMRATTGAVWEGCRSLAQLPTTDAGALCTLLSDALSLVRDAASELTETAEENATGVHADGSNSNGTDEMLEEDEDDFNFADVHCTWSGDDERAMLSALSTYIGTVVTLVESLAHPSDTERSLTALSTSAVDTAATATMAIPEAVDALVSLVYADFDAAEIAAKAHELLQTALALVNAAPVCDSEIRERLTEAAQAILTH